MINSIKNSLMLSAKSIALCGLLFTTGCQHEDLSEGLSPNTPSSAKTSATAPSSIVDLTNWKLQLPYDGSDSGSSADEIKQPTLNGYINSSYFYVSGTGILMKSVLNGARTSSSATPRCELREMNGSSEAKWYTNSGTHQMYASMQVITMPTSTSNRTIIVGQLHDGDGGDYVLGYKLRYNTSSKKYTMELDFGDSTSSIVVDSDYVLGESFNYKFVSTGGKVSCYYNGSLKKTYTYYSSYGQYYKAGCYTTVDNSSSSESASVKVYKLTL